MERMPFSTTTTRIDFSRKFHLADLECPANCHPSDSFNPPGSSKKCPFCFMVSIPSSNPKIPPSVFPWPLWLQIAPHLVARPWAPHAPFVVDIGVSLPTLQPLPHVKLEAARLSEQSFFHIRDLRTEAALPLQFPCHPIFRQGSLCSCTFRYRGTRFSMHRFSFLQAFLKPKNPGVFSKVRRGGPKIYRWLDQHIHCEPWHPWSPKNPNDGPHQTIAGSLKPC